MPMPSMTLSTAPARPVRPGQSDMKPWLSDLMKRGLVPFVATSDYYAAQLDLSLFEGRAVFKLLERAEDKPFHQAYLLANALGFDNPSLKMPNWVYIDCVLMQTAVVGFALPKALAPESLLRFFREDPSVDFAGLDAIPVSGQIAGFGMDGRTLVGFSLFSLRKYMTGFDVPALGTATKAAALYAYRADRIERFLGIAQYNNKALSVHARFGKALYIDRPTIPLHPNADLSFVYRMAIDLDDARIFGVQEDPAEPYDTLMRFDDSARKLQIHRDIAAGHRVRIVRPTQIVHEGQIHLPLRVEPSS